MTQERIDWPSALKETPQEEGESNNAWLRRFAEHYKLSFAYCKKHWYANYAKPKTDQAALAGRTDEVGIPMADVKHYWHKGKHYSLFVKPNQITYFQVRDEIIQELKTFAPQYQTIYYPKIQDGHLLVIDPADIHIGKLAMAFESGEDYNNQVAVQRVREGVHGILHKVQGFNIDKILLVIGNDILHIDTPKRTTTSGTPQDTDGMWYDNFQIAKKIYIEVIETLVQVAPVHVQYDPSNHDYSHGFFLADVIASWFSKVPNVTFNTTISHRKYFQYYGNLIGTTHGDGAKTNDLPLLMAQEAAKAWAECKHRYFYTHHIHHKTSKDHGSVCVESLRSPSGTDGWHHRNGYQHSPKAVEGFLHHKQHGQIARITHIF
jgi:hypothetical protein